MVKRPKALVSWSGGKDSAFACYKALSQGVDIVCLLNAIRKRYGRVAFHGVRRELIELQAEAIGVPLYQFKVNRDNEEISPPLAARVPYGGRRGECLIKWGYGKA
jgi:diphthamide synthase (EF-2-diphthine--ammonia ligase)